MNMLLYSLVFYFLCCAVIVWRLLAAGGLLPMPRLAALRAVACVSYTVVSPIFATVAILIYVIVGVVAVASAATKLKRVLW